MRFAISVPQFVEDGPFDAAGFRAYLKRAEEIGFEGVWVGEQIIGTIPELGPLETLTYAAACTERIRLGCSSLVLPLYSPVHLAKSLSSLDQLSCGRLDVGVTLGGRFRMFSAFGVDPNTLVARFTEQIRLLEALWTQPRVNFDGRFWQLRDAAMEPKPFQKPRPPLWFGASHPAALRRAVALGDAFMGAGSQTTAQFVEQVKVVRDALATRGRELPRFTIAKRVYIAVDDDRARGRRRLTEALDRMYGYFRIPNLEALGTAGTPADCIESLHEVAKAGAELIAFNPLFDDAEQMERLASEVMPQLAA
jgi:probable F420-dependent oxidoreductase